MTEMRNTDGSAGVPHVIPERTLLTPQGLLEGVGVLRYGNPVWLERVKREEWGGVDWDQDLPVYVLITGVPHPTCCRDCETKWLEPEGGLLFRGMVVCSSCGNKRCPKATNHSLDCTNSNEPGQPGSDYA